MSYYKNYLFLYLLIKVFVVYYIREDLYLRGESVDKFVLHSKYKLTGDQPQAIVELVDG